MAWRDDPVRSFKARIAALIMSLYFGCSASFTCFLAFETFFAEASDILTYKYLRWTEELDMKSMLILPYMNR